MCTIRKITITTAFILLLIGLVFCGVYAKTPPHENPKKPDEDIFKNSKAVKFNLDKKKMGKIIIFSCGVKFEIDGYSPTKGESLIPLSDTKTAKLMKNFDTSANYDSKLREIIFTRGKENVMRMKIDYPVTFYGDKEKAIPVPPRIINGKVYISPNSFAKFMWAAFLYEEDRDVFFLDPFVLDVNLETNKKGLTSVVAKGTGPLKPRILKLREPTRFVVDILNSCLDGKARQIKHPKLGDIRFSQHRIKGEEGNIVRIVIPESEEFEIALSDNQTPNFVNVELRPQDTVAPVQDLKVEEIKNLQVNETPDQVTITLETTGPVQMEWNRLLSPDDRYIIDIPDVIYPEKKKEFNLKNDFLPSVRVSQFQPLPSAKVRFVLPLEGPKKVSLINDEKNPNIIKIVVDKTDVDPENTIHQGFMVSYYKTDGMVICLDPGHGGSDPGACNGKLSLMEKHITMDICQRLKPMLKKEGWTVVMTRNIDRDVSYPGSPDYEELGARSQISNDLGSHVFVSIHINASANNQVNGFSTYWYKETDKDLAKSVQQSMISRLAKRDLGIRRERFFVLRHTKAPSILIEAGFISNPAEAKILSTPEFRQKIAESIMQGLRNYALLRQKK